MSEFDDEEAVLFDTLESPDDTWFLADAREINQLYPDTFHIPSAEEVEAIREGDFAKVLFVPYDRTVFAGDIELMLRYSERMWIKVSSKESGKFKGILDNTPATLDELQRGAEIEFGPEAVISIMRT
jgi:hypothetical protein